MLFLLYEHILDVSRGYLIQNFMVATMKKHKITIYTIGYNDFDQILLR